MGKQAVAESVAPAAAPPQPAWNFPPKLDTTDIRIIGVTHMDPPDAGMTFIVTVPLE